MAHASTHPAHPLPPVAPRRLLLAQRLLRGEGSVEVTAFRAGETLTTAVHGVSADGRLVIAGAVGVLKEAGAKSVVIACTHGVFSDPARERLSECGAEEVITTDTLPQSTEGWSNLTVLSIAPLLAQTIHEIFENGSVTTLFDRA